MVRIPVPRPRPAPGVDRPPRGGGGGRPAVTTPVS